MKKYPNCRKRLIRGHEYWIARLVLPADPLTGIRPPIKEFSAKTAAEAHAKREAARKKHAEGPHLTDDARTTFGDYVENEFLPNQLLRTELTEAFREHLSWQRYSERNSRLDKFLRDAESSRLRDTPLSRLQPTQFRAYLQVQGSRLSPYQFNKLRQDLLLALKGLLGRTSLPISEFRLYFPSKAAEVPTPKHLPDADELLDKLEDARYPIEYRSLIAFELVINCRPQDIFPLVWDDIDFDKGLVKLSKRLCILRSASGKSAMGIKANVSKHGKGAYRELPMGSFLTPLMEQLCEHRKAQLTITPYVFCWRDGTMANSRWRMSRLWSMIREEMKLSDGQFYWLKTLGNSYAQAHGVSARVQAEKMGHADSRMAETAYRQVANAELVASVDVFDRRKRRTPLVEEIG